MDSKGIVLISPNERNEYKLGSSSIFYTRLPSGLQSRLAAECRGRRGQLDVEKFNARLLQAAIKGWKGIQDPTGKIAPDVDPSAPVDADMVEALIARLPGEVVTELSNLTTDAAPAEGDLLKN